MPVKSMLASCRGLLFHHGDSFLPLMRGHYLDIRVLGAYQVSASGDLANWSTGAPDAIPFRWRGDGSSIGARRICDDGPPDP